MKVMVLVKASKDSESGKMPSELAFREIGIMIEEILGKDELQDGVAEELQTLIVEVVALGLVAEAGMSQGLIQQSLIVESVAYQHFQRLHRVRVEGSCGLPCRPSRGQTRKMG